MHRLTVSKQREQLRSKPMVRSRSPIVQRKTRAIVKTDTHLTRNLLFHDCTVWLYCLYTCNLLIMRIRVLVKVEFCTKRVARVLTGKHDILMSLKMASSIMIPHTTGVERCYIYFNFIIAFHFHHLH